MDRHVVRDEDDGRAEVALQILDEAQHVLLHHHMSRAVVGSSGNHELGTAHRRETDSDPLTHAARQLVWIGVEDAPIELELVEVSFDTLPKRGSAETQRPAREVLEDAADPRKGFSTLIEPCMM